MNTNRVVCTVLLLLFVCFGILAISKAPESEPTLNLPPEVRTGKVLGIHHYSLATGVDRERFEKFAVEEFLPAFNGVFDGVQVLVMKGERGKNLGHYVLVFDVTSLSVRNGYWPTPGGQTAASKSAWDKCGARCTERWDRFQKMVERTDYTDYVALLKK